MTLLSTIFLIRWLHLIFGSTWIGILYFLNLAQGKFFAETSQGTKLDYVQTLLPVTLWWFRWSSFYAMITGVLMLVISLTMHGPDIFETSWGIFILTGSLIGLVMWANGWFYVFPTAQLVVSSAKQVAAGGQPLPRIKLFASRVELGSRTNALYSLPMLFCMLAASHLNMDLGQRPRPVNVMLGVTAVLSAIQLNAVKGRLGPLESVKGTIVSSIALTALVLCLIKILA